MHFYVHKTVLNSIFRSLVAKLLCFFVIIQRLIWVIFRTELFCEYIISIVHTKFSEILGM